MNEYYRTAIVEALNILSESKLCYLYTLMMMLGFADANTESEEYADAV